MATDVKKETIFFSKICLGSCIRVSFDSESTNKYVIFGICSKYCFQSRFYVDLILSKYFLVHTSKQILNEILKKILRRFCVQVYNFADGRICVIPSFKSRHSFFNEYFSHCFSNSVYIQAHTGKLLNIISSQFRNACWVKWHSQIIHSLTTFNKWWGHHHHTRFKKKNIAIDSFTTLGTERKH